MLELKPYFPNSLDGEWKEKEEVKRDVAQF